MDDDRILARRAPSQHAGVIQRPPPASRAPDLARAVRRDDDARGGERRELTESQMTVTLSKCDDRGDDGERSQLLLRSR